MFYDMKKEIDFLKAHGYTEEALKVQFGLVLDTQVTNRSKQREILSLVSKVEAEQKAASYKAVKQGSATAYTEPFFTKGDDGEWEVVARGIDFIDGPYGPVVKVRRRDGSVSTVEARDIVDRRSDAIRHYTIQ